MKRFFLFLLLFSCGDLTTPDTREPTPFIKTKLCAKADQGSSRNKITDSDNDYIPDNIEECLGFNPLQQDQDQNNILDGLDSNFDQFFDKQWHIRSLGTYVNHSNIPSILGNDLNLINVYHKYMGFNSKQRITVQVVDDGVDVNHEDLNVNIDINLSRDSIKKKMGNPYPRSSDDSHGTMCAGIIAASAFNGVGIRGVSPFAKLAANNWLKNQSITELEEVWLKNDPAGEIAIVSNSWGSSDFRVDQDNILEEYMKVGSQTLRRYKDLNRGKIFVKAAGNGRRNRSNSALHYADNNRYVFSIAALKHDNTHASYSTEGSNLLISAYSGEFHSNSPTIATTTIEGTSATPSEMTMDRSKNCYTKNNGSYCTMPTWENDSKRNYTYGMNGTSASTPMVAGSLALVLEACPFLYWRDLKWLVAKHAKKIDENKETWFTNAAGFHHSTDYGFGLINPEEMIAACQGNNFTPLPPSQVSSKEFSHLKIPILDLKEVTHGFTMQSEQTIEWVGLTIFSNHSYAGDLEIDLISPQGTKTRLIQGKNSGRAYDMKAGHRYGSLAFMGESAKGLWTLVIRDKVKRDEGTLEKINMTIFGH